VGVHPAVFRSGAVKPPEHGVNSQGTKKFFSLQSNGMRFAHIFLLGRPDQAVPTSPTPPGESPEEEAVPEVPPIIFLCILMSAVRCAPPKARTDGSRRASSDQVGPQPSQALRGEANGTSSRELIHTPSLCVNRSIWDSHLFPIARQNLCKVPSEATAKYQWYDPHTTFLLNLSWPIRWNQTA